MKIPIVRKIKPLTSRKICKGQTTSDGFGVNSVACCAMGWINTVLTGNAYDWNKFGKIKPVLRRMDPFKPFGSDDIVNWNDSDKTTKTEIAATLNKLFRRIGALEEAKPRRVRSKSRVKHSGRSHGRRRKV